MSAGLTSEDVAALAPDAKVAAAGRKLGRRKSWQSTGRSAEALWGECKGSAVYQVRADLSDLAVKYSCPSRKQPCKHAIGLLFLSLEAPTPEAHQPDWVSDWLARRAARSAAKKRASSAGESAASPDPAAKEKRAKRRHSRISAGLDALDLWMEDLVRGGLAAPGTKPPSFWDEQKTPRSGKTRSGSSPRPPDTRTASCGGSARSSNAATPATSSTPSSMRCRPCGRATSLRPVRPGARRICATRSAKSAGKATRT